MTIRLELSRHEQDDKRLTSCTGVKVARRIWDAAAGVRFPGARLNDLWPNWQGKGLLIPKVQVRILLDQLHCSVTVTRGPHKPEDTGSTPVGAICPWCSGSTRDSKPLGLGSIPRGRAWRSFKEKARPAKPRM